MWRPAGLVRYGVAPDHPEVKNVVNDFSEVAADPRVSFWGGVNIGSDVPVAALRERYDAVVLAYGAQSDRSMGVPGEQLNGVHSAREFVGWYNGQPELAGLELPLDSVEDVVVIGQGNVAIDCARVLCRAVDDLAKTDIAEHALETLRHSRVRRVFVVGRRGHVQAAFTMKELRECTKLDGVRFVADADELQRGRTPASLQEMETHRARRRMDALFEKHAEAGVISALASGGAEAEAVLQGKARLLMPRFLLSPEEFLPSASDAGAVGAVRFGLNQLTGEADAQRATGLAGLTEELPAGLVLTSIGYRSTPLDDDVPFDGAAHTVANAGGRVVSTGGDGAKAPVRGLYCAGWAKRGPSGIIGTNIPDARETVAAIARDVEDGVIGRSAAEVAADEAGPMPAIAAAHGVPLDRVVDWSQYCALDAAEVAKGEAAGRPRHKVVDVDDMLRIAHGGGQ